MKFTVGEKYVGPPDDSFYIVAEIRNAGQTGVLRNVETEGERWFDCVGIMSSGHWSLSSPPRFEIGQCFEFVTVPGRRAFVVKVRKEGREGLIRFVSEQGERFREEWYLANVFLAGDEWRLLPMGQSPGT